MGFPAGNFDIVTAGRIFDQFATLGLDRMGNNHGRLAVSRVFRVIQRPVQFVPIVTVHFQDIPTECLPFFGERFQIKNIGRQPVDLQFVVIGNRDEIVEFVVRREHGRFPILPFVGFTVTDNAEDMMFFPVFFAAKAIPQAADNPCPSDPVVMSIPGTVRASA